MGALIGFIIVLAVVVVALKLSMAKAPAATDGIVARPILSDNELEFFHRLHRALPDYHVFPQVAVNALLKVAPAVPKKRYHATRNRFAQKHVDFVVCERDTLAVVAIIELDDRTHVAEKDMARDRMLEAGGYRTIRFVSKRKPCEAEITAAVVGTVQPRSDVPELTSF